MNAQEHYAEAEKDLEYASNVQPGDTDAEQFHLARAQVHATLALAAPMVMNQIVMTEPHRGQS